jgi:PAS domain S-box-containing protein
MFASMCDITDCDHRLLDLMPDAVVCVDRDQRVIAWNRTAERLYGYSAAEAVGRAAPKLLDSRFARSIAQAVHTCERTGEWRGTIVNTARDGRRVTVDSRWSARRDGGGALTAIVAVGRELVAELEDPAAPPTALAATAGAVAHDLNNELAVVVNYAALVARELDRLHEETGDERLLALRGDVGEIRAAATRGVQLSRRLFAAALATGPGSPSR